MRVLAKAIIALLIIFVFESLTGFELFRDWRELSLDNIVLDMGCFAVAWVMAILILKLFDATLQEQRASIEQ
ncbi:hypothetical protein [Planctobacterium marinum]|uniref:hypothetical protein n=1 Tax=Planctobacterium marinum TaxID=1631968 RepID=UPI001E5FA338|nr:hypothetical protein [Planctobacterium marinum]MCC2607776.1 hypothetical protein [Planctobacterium marinum]